jgi:putative transcriptional regulator
MVRSLAPCLLLSMPQLVDPNFNRTVVLLCKHVEEGAFGLIVNRPLVTSTRDLDVWAGGPVEPERSWILVNDGPVAAGAVGAVGAVANDEPDDVPVMHVAEGLSLSASSELMCRLLQPNPPKNARLILGYSGWGPRQLEAELNASAWLIADVDRELIFNTPAEEMWETAIRRLGADPATLQMSRGIH